MKTTTILTINFLVCVLVYLPAKTMTFHTSSTDFESSGKMLFQQYCSKCHGEDGTKGKFGAKNLQKSVLNDVQYLNIIQKGKGFMPTWKKKLTADQITDLIFYIKTLKK